MPNAKRGAFGWQGAALVAITYVYFLIFAQFAFLERLASLGVADAHLKAVMAAMAGGGILLSLLAPRLKLLPSPNLRLRVGLGASGVAALLALLPLNFAEAVAVSFLIGGGLGLLTVTLFTHLRRWTGDRNPLLAVGVGTGVGYLICNVPQFFTASTEVQASTAAVLCVVGTGITFLSGVAAVVFRESGWRAPSSGNFFLPCACLLHGTGLVGFGSLLHHSKLSWAESWNLGGHGSSVGEWVGSFNSSNCQCTVSRAQEVIAGSYCRIPGSGCWLCCLLDPEPWRTARLGSLSHWCLALLRCAGCIPIVACAGCFTRGTGPDGRMALCDCGMDGIGDGNWDGPESRSCSSGLCHCVWGVILVPQLIAVFRRRVFEISLTAIVTLVALFFSRFVQRVDGSQQLTQVERGRQVYISEGCIHCHSQYVRPNSRDVLMWGPVEAIAELRTQNPPLVGNRRQGPDLTEVGARRSAMWLKAHFYNPAEVSGASIMPTYGFLFRGERGDDLVAYLGSLRSAGTEQHLAEESAWQPKANDVAQATAADGERLYQRDCAAHPQRGRRYSAYVAIRL